MLKLLGNRILVSKCEEEQKKGFETVNIQDDFLYKGKVEQGGYVDEDCSPFTIKNGDIVLFRKYSPDTEEVELDGRKLKIISIDNVLGIYERN